MKKNMIRKIGIIFLLIFISIIYLDFHYNYTYGLDEQTINEQQQTFGISSFLKEADEYTSEFFEDMDLSELLNSAIKGEIDNSSIYSKILNLFGSQIQTTITSLVSILIIIVIHSVLKSISDGLESNKISNLIYYVQYILIVTIIMTNFSDIVTSVRETCTNLVSFINLLAPILISLMLYTGSITTSSVLEPIILFSINFIGNLIQNILIPIVLVVTTLIILSKISDRVQIEKISKFLQSGVITFLGIALTIFVSIISLEGTLSSSVDGITAKTTKAVVSSAIPIVGKVLGDAVDTVMGCGLVLKNALGIVGVIVIIGICIIPIIKLAVLTMMYKLLAAVTQPIADGKIVSLLDQIGDIFKIFLAIVCALSVMLIIGTTLVIKISNSGMMYR